MYIRRKHKHKALLASILMLSMLFHIGQTESVLSETAQGPSFKKGPLEGQAAGVLEVLDARGLPVDTATRERVQACQDPEQLRQWLRRAAVVSSAEELFS